MKEELKLIKKGLIIVDMINGFVNEGSLADPYIKTIIEENVRIAKEFIENNDAIIAFKDVHEEDSLEFNSFPVHCLKGTNETELVPELKKLENNFKIIEKNSTSGMFAKGFIEYINSMASLTEIVITGCCTDICILNLAIPLKNYFNQLDKNINIIVPENAVETYHIEGIHNREEYNKLAFKLMNQAGIQMVKKYEVKHGK